MGPSSEYASGELDIRRRSEDTFMRVILWLLASRTLPRVGGSTHCNICLLVLQRTQGCGYGRMRGSGWRFQSSEDLLKPIERAGDGYASLTLTATGFRGARRARARDRPLQRDDCQREPQRVGGRASANRFADYRVDRLSAPRGTNGETRGRYPDLTSRSR